MSTISVLPNPGGPGPAFRAVADGVEGAGAAPGEAIDALFAQTGRPTGATLVFLQPDGPDEFFPADKLNRLAELMTQLEAARGAGKKLTPELQAELEVLTAEEFYAAAARCAALMQRKRP